MSESKCGEVRELLPLYAEGVLGDPSGVVEHLAVCGDCRAELDLVRALAQSRPLAPADLASVVSASVQADLADIRVRPTTAPATARRTVTPWWQLTAAAVAALALGVGVTSNLGSPELLPVPEYASELEEEDLWLSGDGLLAGAPALDALSDEALAQLLDELEFAVDGGAA